MALPTEEVLARVASRLREADTEFHRVRTHRFGRVSENMWHLIKFKCSDMWEVSVSDPFKFKIAEDTFSEQFEVQKVQPFDTITKDFAVLMWQVTPEILEDKNRAVALVAQLDCSALPATVELHYFQTPEEAREQLKTFTPSFEQLPSVEALTSTKSYSIGDTTRVLTVFQNLNWAPEEEASGAAEEEAAEEAAEEDAEEAEEDAEDDAEDADAEDADADAVRDLRDRKRDRDAEDAEDEDVFFSEPAQKRSAPEVSQSW